MRVIGNFVERIEKVADHNIGPDYNFWLAAFGGASLRIALEYVRSGEFRPVQGTISILGGVFLAWAATDSTVYYLKLDPEIYTESVAALWGIVGLNVVGILLLLTKDLKGITELLKLWRGK